MESPSQAVHNVIPDQKDFSNKSLLAGWVLLLGLLLTAKLKCGECLSHKLGEGREKYRGLQG